MGINNVLNYKKNINTDFFHTLLIFLIASVANKNTYYQNHY